MPVTPVWFPHYRANAFEKFPCVAIHAEISPDRVEPDSTQRLLILVAYAL
jgi:hypothetical protein